MREACRHYDRRLSGKTEFAYVCVQQQADTEVQDSTAMACLAAEQSSVLLVLTRVWFLHRISCLMTLLLLLQHLHKLWLLARWSQRHPAHPGLCRTKLLHIESMCWHISSPRLQDRIESWADNHSMQCACCFAAAEY